MKKQSIDRAIGCFLLLGILFSSSLLGSASELFDSSSVMLIKEKKGKWFYLPILLFSPEESLIIGAGGVYLFKLKKADSLTRQSNLQASVLYTLNHQFITEPNYFIFFDKEKYILRGMVGFSRFPYYYFGIGNNTSQKNKELVSYDIIKFDNTLLREVNRKLYIGLGYRYYNMFQVQSPSSGIMEKAHVAGYNGSVSAGINIVLLFDNRNNILNSTKGTYISVINTLNGYAFGGNFNFNKLVIDIRKFISPFSKKNHTIAFQTFIQCNSGNSPFNELGLMGGSMIMRGYYLGQYRDNVLGAAQLEYRVKLTKRFGLASFISTGEVADKLSTIYLSGFKASYGLGLRVNVSKKDNVNLRLDYGFGNGVGLWYFAVAESF